MSNISNNIQKQFRPDISHPLYLIRTHLYRKIKELAPQLKGKIMDFGCGLKPYRSLFSVDEYIGVDYHGDGKTYEKSLVDVFYDGKTIPFPDASFDGIFCSEVFEHVFNLQDIMKELNRVLKPGGKILITCPFSFGEHEIPSDYARYTSFAIKHLFESNGFRILQQYKTGTYIEAVAQLWIEYWNMHLLSKALEPLPVIRTIIRKSFFISSNLLALSLNWVLPKRHNLYLNNVVLAEKI